VDEKGTPIGRSGQVGKRKQKGGGFESRWPNGLVEGVCKKNRATESYASGLNPLPGRLGGGFEKGRANHKAVVKERGAAQIKGGKEPVAQSVI